MKKILNVILAAILLIATVAFSVGCDTTVEDVSISLSDWDGKIDYTETNDTISYTFFLLDGDLNTENNIIIKEIERKFNVKIKVIGGGASDWKMALANKINANEIPDLFFSLPDSGTYANYIDTQTIMPLDTLIERADAQNLKKLFAAEPYNKNAKIGGINFFAPLMQEATEHAFYINKEWMAAWNESRGEDADTKPVTLDEFTSMLKYFHDDTSLSFNTNYGLALSSNWDFLKSLMSTFGCAIDWKVGADGEFTLSALSEEYKEFLTWVKEGVDYGYIYPGFDTDTDGDSIQKLVKKICGACINNGGLKIEEVPDEWDTTGNTPIDDLLVCVAPPDNGENKGAFWGTNGFWGGVSIGINAQEPMRLIRILDYLYSEEGSIFSNYGVEGRDFDYDDKGNIVIDERHYQNRTDDQCFYTPKKRGDYGTKPIGGYKYNFVGSVFAFDGDEIVFKFNEANYWNKDFAREVYEYSSTRKVAANPTFLLDNMAWADYNSKILDAAERFSLQVIKGTKTYENALSDLKNTIEKYKYEELREYLRKQYNAINA